MFLAPGEVCRLGSPMALGHPPPPPTTLGPQNLLYGALKRPGAPASIDTPQKQINLNGILRNHFATSCA